MSGEGGGATRRVAAFSGEAFLKKVFPGPLPKTFDVDCCAIVSVRLLFCVSYGRLVRLIGTRGLCCLPPCAEWLKGETWQRTGARPAVDGVGEPGSIKAQAAKTEIADAGESGKETVPA